MLVRDRASLDSPGGRTRTPVDALCVRLAEEFEAEIVSSISAMLLSPIIAMRVGESGSLTTPTPCLLPLSHPPVYTSPLW